jgi:hypothetical protein
MALNLTQWFEGLFKVDAKNWFTSFLSGFGRTRMEPVYDWIAQTRIFQELKNKPPTLKHAMEAANNALFSFLDQKIDEHSQLRKLTKEIVMDGSSELNKRLINGEPVKNILAENAGRINNPLERNLLAALLLINEKELIPLLEQLILMTEDDRVETLKRMRGLSEEAIAKLAGLSEETRAMLFTIGEKSTAKNGKTGFFTGTSDVLRRRLTGYLEKKKENGHE